MSIPIMQNTVITQRMVTTQNTVQKQDVSLERLEPRGTQVMLGDLLRWRLAAPHIPLENRRNSSQLAGGRRSTLRGRGIDFDEVRLYQPGDDVRAIDWRVTARTGKPHTKIFREEKERPVLLVIDLRSAMFFGSRRCFKSVLAANTAALLAWATLESGDRIGAMLISDDGITDIKPRRSRHTVLQLFRQIIAIAEQQQQKLKGDSLSLDPPQLQDAMQQLRVIARPGSCNILLGDFHDWNENCARALHPVVRHSQCFALQTIDALEQQLPAVGFVRLRSLLRKAAIDTNDQAMMSRFQSERTQQQQILSADLRTLRIPLLPLHTGENLFPAVRQFFSSGGSHG
jgi:uncharacterized protein (DUF58 family)